MEKEIIKCPDCKGSGGFTYERKAPFFVKIATFGFANLCDEEWDEKCKRCDGLGKIKVSIKEE